MVGQGAGDALTNPPGGVGAEFESHAVLIFVNRPHEPTVPFLNQVAERQPPAAVALGDRHDESEISLSQFATGFLINRPAAIQDSSKNSQLLGGALRF